MKKHTELVVECQWDKDHSNQKTYRDSAAVWFTVPAMAKIQAKLGITDETTNQSKAVMLLGKMAGIEFAPEDFDRTKGAELPKEEAKTAQTDSGVNSWILKLFQNGETESHIKNLMLSNGWTPKDIEPYFKKKTSVPLPPK